MSVIVKNEDGWFTDHKRASVVAMGKHDDQGMMEKHYRLKADLFEIVEPFCMDSQHKKQQSLNPLDQKRKRKRKRREPLNIGEQLAEEFHNKVRHIILNAFESLIQLAEAISYFQPESTVSVRDNNKLARQAAQWTGSSTFIDLFEHETWNQSLNLHNAGTQLLYTSDCKKTQEKDEIQNCKTKLISEEEDLSVSGLLNTVWQHDADTAVTVKYKGDNFIIPPHSKFLLSDISYLLLESRVLGTYDLIVIDPPWTNKSVKRKKKYYTMENDMMLNLPLKDMMNPGCVVVVWVTNKQKHIQFVKEELFLKNNIECLASWFWLKVTKTGQCVYDLDSSHKKPYETLIIGKSHSESIKEDKVEAISNDLDLDNETDIDRVMKRNEGTELKEKIYFTELHKNLNENVFCENVATAGDISRSDCKVNEKAERSMSECYHGNKAHIPDNRVIISTPCSLHSKKPPLQDILQPYLPTESKCLELFARNLTPCWTSWGNEVLLHQHISFYEEII